MPAPAMTRQVQVRILTSVGWMDGFFEIPRIQNFFEWLDKQGAFVRLSSARLPDGRTTSQQFALHRKAILVVLPAAAKEAERGRVTAGREVEHEVSCLTTYGLLHGKLRTYQGVRMADYLLHHAGFIVLRDCVVHRAGQAKPQTLPVMLVNAEHVVGVNDEAVHLIGQAAAPAATPAARTAPAAPRGVQTAAGPAVKPARGQRPASRTEKRR